jgi:glycosyltransferase involved in cell wall biosynthesis
MTAGAKRNHKILLIITNLGRGGAQQVFRDQLQFLSKNFNTIGCVFNLDDAFSEDHNSNIISLGIPAGKNWLGKITCFCNRVIALRKIKKRHHITLSISHLEGADYVNLLSKRNEKVISWIHGSKTFDENIQGALGTFRKKLLIPLTYRLCDKVVTVSNGIRVELIKNFRIPPIIVTTIYNSFELERIFEKAVQPVASDHQELFDSSAVFITHCRLSREKNLFALIDIFLSVKNTSDTKLMILGDGELRDELIKYCRSHKLRIYSIWESALAFNPEYDIYFMGYERNPYPLLSRATLYLMTSSWEGFPLSLCEAMASGVPVVSTDCFTGPREIIHPGLNAKQPIQQPNVTPYGVLMPLAKSDTIQTWTDTILALLNDNTLRNKLITGAKERVAAFDRKKISAQWLAVIEESSK